MEGKKKSGQKPFKKAANKTVVAEEKEEEDETANMRLIKVMTTFTCDTCLSDFMPTMLHCRL